MKFAYIISEPIKRYFSFWNLFCSFKKKEFQVIFLERIGGYLIIYPSIEKKEKKVILEKLAYLKDFVKEKNIKLLGWSGFRYLDFEDIRLLGKMLEISFTSGVSLLSWSIFEGIYRLSRIKNIDLKNLRLGFMDLEEPVINLTIRRLFDLGSKIFFNSKDYELAQRIKDFLMEINPSIEIKIENNQDFFQQVDIVVVYSLTEELSLPQDKPVFYIKNNSYHFRDKNLICLGLIKIPYSLRLSFYKNLPKDIVPAEFAETALLAKENNFVNYSFDENTNPDKVSEIADISAKNGFEVWIPQLPFN